MDILPCFSTPVCVDTVDYKFNQQYLESLEYWEYDNQTGFMSVNQNILLEDEFSGIKEQVEKKINIFLFDFLKISQGNIKHCLSWINLHKHGNFAPSHCHSNSFYSGVVYLKYPPDSGKIWFHHPLQFPTFSGTTLDPLISEHNIYNSKSWSVEPKDNMLVFFPSHLNHSTEVNNSFDDRYSIAFNYFIEGEIGKTTGKVCLSSNEYTKL